MVAYQPIVLVEEFLRYLVEEETVCSLAIERIEVQLKDLEEKKLSADKKTQQALNYLKTAEEVYKLAYQGFKTDKEVIDEPLILWAYQNLWQGFGIKAEYRKTPMQILGALFEPPSPEAVPFLMQTIVKWLKEEGRKLPPIRRATIFHLLFEVIHPFEDGNGRLGRILMNAILIEGGYINVAFRNREEYISALKQSQEGAVIVIEALARGKRLSVRDITETVEYYSNLEVFENLIRKEILRSLQIYGRKLNIYLTPKEVSELLGYKNPDYVRVLINRKKLFGEKTPYGWRIPLSEVIRFAESKLNLERTLKTIFKI